MSRIPQQRASSFTPADLLVTMFEHIKAAVKSRENYRNSARRAREAAGMPGTPYQTAQRPIDAEMIFQGSPSGKLMIADNRWQMMQALMFGVADIAKQQRMQTEILREIRDELRKGK
jgi:hypothetical protein